MYSIGKFYQATNVEDAVRALMEGPETAIISGGSDVPIKIREGKLADCSLVNIHGIKKLESIRMEEDEAVVIGPTTTSPHITNNDIIQKHIPMLGDAADVVGGPQLRSIGIIGGNVCSGVISVDSASNLCCLDAVLVLKGPDGVRETPISQWYTGSGRTVRSHDEVLTAIRIKKENYQGYDGQYTKYDKRGAMGIVTPGCAANAKLTEDKKYIQGFRLAYGVAVPTLIRCHTAEEAVKGTKTGEALAQAVGKSALKEVNPHSSWRTSREFRLQLMKELGRRAVKQAVVDVGGERDV